MNHVAVHPTHGRVWGLSLCSGGGMLDVAVTIAEPGYRTVCYVEWEAYAAATLVARMADASLDQAPVWDDIRTFGSRAWRGCLDILVAGYPCQPFSQAGQRRGVRDERHLWPHVRRHAVAARVPVLFLENVEGHLRLGFDVVCRQLQRLGYIVEAGLFSAAEVGAAHSRARLFIMAYNPRFARVLYEGSGRPDKGAADPGRSGGTVADHPGQQRDGWPHHVLSRQSGFAVSSQELADHHGTGLSHPQFEGHLGPAGGRPKTGRPVKQFCGPSVAEGGYEEPLFAPGPADDAAWVDILSHRPSALPAVRRAFDGVAHRVDRLRVAGNGVVPLAGAHAYSTLKARLLQRLSAGAGGAGIVRW